MKRILIILFLIAGLGLKGFSGEGLWIPLLIDSLNYSDMLSKGLRISPEDIYSAQHPSLKDAVVIFGGGCTGEVISPEGLLITNYHCGESYVHAHSTLENNYIKEGFWASSQSEELPNPGLSVRFLVRIEDVTEQVLENVTEDTTEEERSETISGNIAIIEKEAVEGHHYNANVNSFYFGTRFYLFVYEVYTDIRLVGTPPGSIGRFGGDTDNWVWPRHTGDFMIFRIYADKDNNPAVYSPDNVPYQPKKYLSISVEGLNEGDFTMILGYPGNTDEYLTSDALEMISKESLPAKIAMREVRLNAIQEEMNKSEAHQLQFRSQYFSVSNSWKKWIGIVQGIERSDAIAQKLEQENDFTLKAGSLQGDNSGYLSLMDEFKDVYKSYRPLYLSYDTGNELYRSVSFFSHLNTIYSRINSVSDSSAAFQRKVIEDLSNSSAVFYEQSSLDINRKILPSLLKIYADYNDKSFYPGFYYDIQKNYDNDYDQYVNHILSKSTFPDSLRSAKLFKKNYGKIQRTIMNDPLIMLNNDFISTLHKVYFEENRLNTRLNTLYRRFFKGLQLFNPDSAYYSDANFTMRLTYGKIEGYQPHDAVEYGFSSTIDGIFQKENPNIPDYSVNEKLRELYNKKDYGEYEENGTVPVCFIASNHTSGGNSGSPVFNADGNLIGINFDRNWEGTVSDYNYDPQICRNISLDIRYVLFIIDKFADKDWILDELTIVGN